MVTCASAEDFVKNLDRLKKDGDSLIIQNFLDKSAEVEKNNPDYYALAGNYWWGFSQSTSISTKPSVKGDFSLRDQKSGVEVGSISTVGQLNPEIPKKAVSILTEGARLFPQRADIMLGLAYIQNESGMNHECVETLLKLLEFASKNPGDLRWAGNAKLPSEASKFIPEAIQGYSAGFYQRETDEFDALCIKLCDATIQSFPDHPFAYNIKAALAASKGQQGDALKYLETAHSKAPNDPLILLNLGDTYLKNSKTDAAKDAYAKVMGLDEIDDSLKQQARKVLSELEQVK